MPTGYPHVYVSNALDHFTSRSMGHQVMARWFVSIKLSADAILQPITYSNETYLAELLHSTILLIRILPKEIWIFFSEFFTLATFKSQPILYEWGQYKSIVYSVIFQAYDKWRWPYHGGFTKHLTCWLYNNKIIY